MQRADGNVEFRFVRVFDRCELRNGAVDFERPQPEVPTDAVVDVDDGRADVQFGEVSNDLVRIDRSRVAPGVGVGACTEYLRLCDQRERVGHHAAVDRRDVECELRLALTKRNEVVDVNRVQSCAREELVEHLAPPGGFGAEQHRHGRCANERGETLGRLMRAVVHGYVGQRLRGEFDAVVPPVEDDLAQFAERAEHLLRAQIDRIRRQDRALDIVAQTLVARSQIRLKRQDFRVERVGYHSHTIGGQIVEDRRERRVEQRQVILDAGRRHALTHVLIDRTAPHVDVEQLVPTIAKAGDRIGRQREFFRRQDLDGGDLIDRPLCVGIERTQARNFVIEEIDAVRRRRPHREDVDERTADREFAAFGHRVDAAIARLFELRAIAMRIEPFADREHQAVRREKRRRRQTLQQRANRHHEYAAPQRRQPVQRAQPVRHDVLVRRERVVRQRLPVRQRDDVERSTRKKFEFARDALRGGGIGRDREHEAVVSLRGTRDGKTRGAIAQAAPTDAFAGTSGKGWSVDIGHVVGVVQRARHSTVVRHARTTGPRDAASQ